jgi:uncharacterized protein with von Willebrand factor type A (vWA) domain
LSRITGQTRLSRDLIADFLDDLAASPARRIDFMTALKDPPPNITRLYWLARVTLVERREDIAPFNAVFAAHFHGAPPIPETDTSETEAPQPSAGGELQPVAIRKGTGRSAAAEDLPNRRTYDPTTESLAELRQALAEHLPRVRSRRQRTARRGRLDLRRTLRHATRTGEITQLARRDRPRRPRRLLLLIDVSGSLRDHTPDYLRFAWAAQAETFTFGTRLTRITSQLRHRDVDVALAHAADTIPDADGGTRIGAALSAFLATPRYADRARGALTIVLSDGLERGDPHAMIGAVHRLKRLSHRLLWWTPLATDPTYQPITRAMAAIRPDVELAGARDLPTLLERVRTL